MTKRELAQELAKRNNLRQKDAEAAVKSVINIISDSLAKGEKIQFTGFGTFAVRERSERIGHNPREKGATIVIPARKIPYFKTGKTLKDSVNK